MKAKEKMFAKKASFLTLYYKKIARALAYMKNYL